MAAFFVAVWQDCEFAPAFVASCLRACLAVWCQVCGMHSPRDAAAKHPRLDLQHLCDYYL